MNESNLPVYTRWNPPGQHELTYRAGTYPTILQRLLAALEDQETLKGRDLPPLHTDPQDNWAIGLLQAWAIVLDVLTFYQERIANEGYLSTATERRSLMELARLTGYELRPGVSASTYLAFTVGAAQNGAALSCLLPKGVAVQSVPTQGQQVISFPGAGNPPAPPQLPQTFETSEQFEAHSEWNAILPAKSSSVVGRTFRPGTLLLRLDGIKTGLRAGDAILLVGGDPSYTEQNRPWIFASLTQVTADPKQWFTQIVWESEVRRNNDATPIKNPLVFVFHQQAKFFGYTRSGVAYSFFEQADWSPSGIGLPNTTVYKLLRLKNGSLFAATDNGVFRSINDGESWEAVNAGLMRVKVQSLTSIDDGTLYAGTGSGNIFVSSDNGNNWRLLVSRPRRAVGLLALLPLPRPQDSPLPKSVIHDLTTFTDGKKRYLVAATDNGVFQSSNGGQSWQRPHTGVSAQEVSKRGSAWSFAAQDGKIPFVGMDNGVYPVEVKRRFNWRLPGSLVGIFLAVVALVFFILGVLEDKLGAPLPTEFITQPTLCTFQGCVGSIPAYMVALPALLVLAVLLILAFLLVGQKPPIEISSGKFPWLARHWHGLRNAALVSVVIEVLLYLPAFVTYNNPQLSDSQFAPFFIQYGTIFYIFLRFLLVGYAFVAVVLAGFLLVLWLRKHPASAALTVTTRALAFLRDGSLLAGTAQGIYRSRDQAQNWEWLPQSPAKPLFTVPLDAHLSTNDLDAGHLPDALSNAFASNGLDAPANAVLTVSTRGQSWKLTSSNTPTLYILELTQGQLQVACVTDIRAIETGAPSFIFAGTQDGSVFRAQADGEVWTEFDNKLQLAQIQSFAAGMRGLFVAGLPVSGESESQWSRFQLREHRLDLDKLYPALLAESWIVLRQDSAVAAYRASSVSTSARLDFKKGKDFTSLIIESEDSLTSFDRNAASLFIQSEQVALFDDQPIQGDTIPFATFVPGLSQDQKLLVSGKRLRLRLTGQIATAPVLVSSDGLRQAPFTADDTLIVLGITANPAGDFTWQLEDRNGFVGHFTAPIEVISYEPASEQDQVVSELISILAVQTESVAGQATTTIKLETPLHNVYDRASTGICANVVYATHGQTIENEVLGGVDTSRDQRRFMLKQKPLTYTSAIDAEEHMPDTLQVLVNGVPWHQVSSLYDASSNQRAFTVQQDSQNATWLSFGDGEHGAHLPSGREHITATYRIGGGKAGNVAAQSLTTLRKRPPGVQKVINPIPASGGADPESLAMARVNAPLHVQQTIARVISLNDFIHFARAYAGIGKAEVQTFWRGRQRQILLTIASEDGQPIDKASPFYQDLQQALSKAAAWSARSVELEPCETLYFQLEAMLILTPAADADIVKTKVVQRLTQIFSFARRELAQPVAASEVITAIQEVQGVTGVKLQNLFLKDKPAALNSLLEARTGRVENGISQPAQLLLIDAVGQGITLHVE